MPHRIHHLVLAATAAFVLVLAPVGLDRTDLFDISAQAGNGKGGGGNSGGSSNGNSGGGNGGGSKSSGNSGKSSDGGGGQPVQAKANGNGTGGGNDPTSRASKGKKGDVAVQTAAIKKADDKGKRSLNAELAGLNSLKRNINGLMNSSDPRMEGVRQFILANAAQADAQSSLEAAQAQLGAAQAAYADLLGSLGLAPETTPESLAAEIALIDEQLALTPDDPDLLAQRDVLEGQLAAISAEYASLMAAQQAVSDAEAAIADLAGQTDDAALTEALRTAANPNRLSDDYLSGEVWEWARQRVDMLVSDYLAQH